MEAGKLVGTQDSPIVIVPEDTGIVISEQTAELIRSSLAPNTLKNYKRALKLLGRWLNGRQITDQNLAEYFTHLFHEGKAPSTIDSAFSAVKWLLKRKTGKTNLEFPITFAALSGIRRKGRNRGYGQRNGLTWTQVAKMCAVQETSGTLQGLRNSALFRVMSDGLLRACEAAELKVGDIQDNGMVIRFSKTDQEGKGEHLYLCKETRKIIKQYLERAGITKGYLFQHITARGDMIDVTKQPPLSYASLRWIIKHSAAKVGIEEKIATHSLRIGSAVSLAQHGATVVEMQLAGRWKSPSMPAHYARAQLSEKGAIAKFKETD